MVTTICKVHAKQACALSWDVHVEAESPDEALKIIEDEVAETDPFSNGFYCGTPRVTAVGGTDVEIIRQTGEVGTCLSEKL